MKNILAHKSRIVVLSYVFYGIVLLAVLLIVFFPAKKIRNYCTSTIEQIFPGTTCHIDSIGYGFPATLHFHKVQVFEKGRSEETIVSVRSLSFQADLQHPGVRVVADLYDGKLQCRLSINRSNGTIILNDIEAHHVDLGKWGRLQKILGRDISGYLDLSGRYKGNIKEMLQGEAEGKAMVHGGGIELLHPILSLTSISLLHSEIKFMFKNRILTITNGGFYGTEFDCTFNGMFHIAFPASRSMLELSGDLKPTISLVTTDKRWKSIETIMQRRFRQSTIPFVVNGSLAAPRFRFGG
jgi:type II secretion system protein N